MNTNINKYKNIPFRFIGHYDNGYLLMKYTKNTGFYNWHDDSFFELSPDKNNVDKCSCRMYAFLWYLNDVDIGGETEFIHKKIKPEKGKLIMFPASKIYQHKGCMPVSNDKYICTGWLYSDS